jgi:RNA polymerase sigma-70 factor (ECF subfamily)
VLLKKDWMSDIHDLNTSCKDTVYEKIYKDNVVTLRNYLYYKFGNLNDAEDVVQNAFIKLWENCAKVPVEKAKSFLYTTANNMSLNIIKHNKVVLKHNLILPKSTTNETPEFEMIGQEFQVKLQKAIGDLTEKQREVFLLSRIEKMKYAEIAELLQISVKAVEKRMHNALLLMRARIEQL